ncbi:restriction endonuclease fold toxin 5 domain-containing protein [Pseudoduganella sp. LjRoot289]|uniref:Tox-REase-5 domain-containing protein n=1 Tax=Pseudoduganella sp. LjRoot289 TaxID=3342314 RepID=UPI003ECFFE19
MAALAIPPLEAVAARALVALGVGAAAGAADEAARKRQKEADQARSTPIARTEAQTKTKEKCKDCAPDKGMPYLRNTAGWSDDSITYQMRIAQMPPAPAGFLTEWNFGGVKFDGFNSAQCLLKEAKARYDQFFDEWGRFKYRFQDDIFAKMTAEAVSQNNAAVPKPPTQLQWHFMEPTSYRYMSKVLSRATPEIEVLYRP